MYQECILLLTTATCPFAPFAPTLSYLVVCGVSRFGITYVNSANPGVCLCVCVCVCVLVCVCVCVCVRVHLWRQVLIRGKVRQRMALHTNAW